MDKSYKRAIIEIENHEVEEVKEEEKKSSAAELGGKAGMSDITERISTAGADMAFSGKPLTVDAISGAADNRGGGNEKKQFPVQFNPVNIRLTSTGKKSRPKTGVDEEHQTIDYGMLGVSMTAIIPLIFDKSDIDMSVAENVEEFIQAVENPNARKIRFSWGNLIYEGVLSDVTAEYTMFSGEGEPLRANVGLKLLCRNEEGMEYWQEKREENFEEE